MATTHDTVVERQRRELWVDNLRVAVVAGVIVVHTGTAYITDVADWHYDQRTTTELWSILIAFPLIAAAMFGLGPLFFLAGWFSPPSLGHRGPAGFARSRLVRLGIPLIAFVLVIQPVADYVGGLVDDEPRSFSSCLRSTEFGVMWFVVAILVFSLVYAGLRYLRPATPPRRPVRLGRLLILAALTIAVVSLVVWQVWPWNSDAFRTLRLGEWPQAAVLFALGVHAGETGWLRDLPHEVVRRLGWTALVGTVVTFGLFGVLESLDQSEAVLDEAEGWGTPVFALLDGVVAVSLSLWLLVWVRRRWPSHGPLLGKAARASYATYVIHPLVLTTVMVLADPIALAPEIKFVLVSIAGVAACFAVGYALTRLPGVAKVV